MATKIESELSGISAPIKIAIMGCSVNGPGEAKQADIGIAGGKGSIVIFKGGKIWKSGPEREMSELFIREIMKMEEAAKKQK